MRSAAVSPLAPKPATPELTRLREACHDLEEVFMRHLVREMRTTVVKDTSIGESVGSGIYDSMIEQALSSALTDGGGVGIADLLYAQLHWRFEPASGGQPAGARPDAVPGAPASSSARPRR
jgi:Rod binding domain-containing protein